MTTQLWEILVPCARNDGRPFHTRYHRVWDNKVRAITGGLTVMPVAKGQWVAQDGAVFKERMIPVRIACTRKQIEEIIAMTMIYYDQLAVMAYRVSEEVILRHKDPVLPKGFKKSQGKQPHSLLLNDVLTVHRRDGKEVTIMARFVDWEIKHTDNDVIGYAKL